MPYTSCSPKCKSRGDCTDCREIQAVEKEIKQLKKALKSATERRTSILSRMNSRWDPLTSKLPIEIIYHIFEDYVSGHEMEPEDYADNDHSTPRYFPAIHRGAPLQLGTVCKRWRTIVWGCPQFWKTLVVSLGCPGYALGPVMVREWLSRTCELPLSIQIFYRDGETAEIDQSELPERYLVLDCGRTIMQEIGRYSPRWASLDFTGAPLELLKDLGIRYGGDSMLKHLCFGGHYEDWDDSITSRERIQFNTTHSPTHLTLLCQIHPRNVNINWTGLTNLYVEGIVHEAFYDVVRHVSTTLTHLSVGAIGRGSMLHSPPIWMSRLVSLSIDEFNSQCNSGEVLFDCLTTPSLRSLAHRSHVQASFAVSTFLQFLQRSSFLLEDIELVRPVIDTPRLQHMLQNLPSVKSLRIENYNRGPSFTSDFFNLLAEKNLKNATTACLPNLVRLDLHARPPKSWASLIGIFVDDPDLEIPVLSEQEDTEAINHIPMRRDLQLKFTVHTSPIHLSILNEYIDIRSLTTLVRLWKKHGVRCIIQKSNDKGLGEAEDPATDLLVQSFDALIPKLKTSMAQQYESSGMREDLLAMFALKF